MIYKYIRRTRDGRRVKIGMLGAGRRNNGHVYIGWSKCNMRADPFDCAIAREMAMSRFFKNGVKVKPPKSIHKNILRFAARCVKYFQVTDIRVA